MTGVQTCALPISTYPERDVEDEHSPHLNTTEDPYLARRTADAETERTRQLDALEQMRGTRYPSHRARALARARRPATEGGTR